MTRSRPRFPVSPVQNLTLAHRTTPLIRRPNLTGARSYQAHGIRWLSAPDATNRLLADEMRLGKSFQTLRSLESDASALVVCPAVVCMVWRNEVAKWRPDLRSTLVSTHLRGWNIANQNFRAPRRGEVVICSYDSLPDIIPGWTKALVPESLRHVTLIGDEIHYCKSDDALRTKKWRLLAQQCWRVWGLTGTPLVGKLEDLYGVLVSLRMGEGCATGKELAELYRGRSEESIAQRLAHCMLRRTRRDVVDELPDKTYQLIPVPTPDDLRDWLDQLTEQWEELDLGPMDLPPFEMFSEARKALARARIDDAVSFARDLMSDGEPLIIFSAHRDPIVEMGLRLPRTGVVIGDNHDEHADVIRRFQEGDLQAIALTMKAGGIGVDLSAADRILQVDLGWNPSDNWQAEKRAESMQKMHPLHVYRMVSDHAIDMRVMEILARKQALIDKVVDRGEEKR